MWVFGFVLWVGVIVVGYIDILLMFVNLVGVTASAEMMGRSLLPLIAGGPEDLQRPVFQQLSYENNHEQRGAATGQCHVIYNVSPHTSWEVYRLDIDPNETHDQVDNPGPCATVRTAFEHWYDSAQIPAGASEALLTTAPTIAAPLDVDFGPTVRLLAVEAPAQVHPGDAVPLTFTFAARGRMARGWVVSVHWFGPNGGHVQADHVPPRPFEWWRAGQFIRYTITANVPITAPPGAYQIRVGLWRKGPHPVHAPGGRPIVNGAAEVATVTVTR